MSTLPDLSPFCQLNGNGVYTGQAKVRGAPTATL